MPRHRVTADRTKYSNTQEHASNADSRQTEEDGINRNFVLIRHLVSLLSTKSLKSAICNVRPRYHINSNKVSSDGGETICRPLWPRLVAVRYDVSTGVLMDRLIAALLNARCGREAR